MRTDQERLSQKEITKELLDTVSRIYCAMISEDGTPPGIRAVANAVNEKLRTENKSYKELSTVKCRKLLITAGVYESDNETFNLVSSLHKRGMNCQDIQRETGLKHGIVNAYLPYSKVVYNMDLLGGAKSYDALKQERYRSKHREGA